MDFCTRIQQHAIAHDCTILNTGILQNDTPITKFGVGANVGTGCNDIRESIAHCRSFLIYLHPEVVITNANHEQTITLAQLRQIRNLTNNRSTTNPSPNRLSIVHKSAVILEHCLLGHHASKTTSTDDQQFLFHVKLFLHNSVSKHLFYLIEKWNSIKSKSFLNFFIDWNLSDFYVFIIYFQHSLFFFCRKM